MSGNHPPRRNWTRSLTIVSLLAIGAAAIGILSSNKQDAAATERVYIRNSAGAVLFDHAKHSESAESCAVCHHPLYSAEQATSCADCHDEGVSAEDVDHETLKENHGRNCATCHEAAEPVEVLNCRSCHETTAPAEPVAKSCSDCHDDGHEPGIVSHDEYLEVDDHSCLGCHTPQTISQTYHAQCISCHQETGAERFVTAEGEVSCGSCHLP